MVPKKHTLDLFEKPITASILRTNSVSSFCDPQRRRAHQPLSVSLGSDGQGLMSSISTTAEKQPVKNQIGAALAERIVSAAREGRKFKIIVIIPAVPAFPGDIKSQSGLKAIMEAQYRTINRGGSSIFDVVRKEGFEPMDYITFWNLRSYDRINSPFNHLAEMEKKVCSLPSLSV